MDFALWKAQKPGEPAWESPWGMGRPGWHIECSAMVNKFLGASIDIHSGGKDLIFPHHENEIAQSECANGCSFANYWMHNGYININNQKMSKSLGNFFTIRDITEKYKPEVVRFFMLSAHYRSPVNFSDELMSQAQSAMERVYTCIDNLKFLLKNAVERDANGAELEILATLEVAKKRFCDSMDDDLNTADAISAIFDIVSAANKGLSQDGDNAKDVIEKILSQIHEIGDVLGLFEEKADDGIDAEIEALIEKRNEARKNKDWAEADRIRDELKARNIVLKDTPMGVKWSYIE